MTINKYIVNRQTSIHGDTADIALHVHASGISVQDAENANGAFDQFLSVITGKPLGSHIIKRRHGSLVKWDDEERNVIKNCSTSPEAVRAYREKFPESTRKESGITRMWLYLKDKQGTSNGSTISVKEILGKHSVEKKGNRSKNFDADRWTDPERDVVRDAESRADVIANYRQKFPDSKRSDDAICRQFYEIHPDKRSPDLPWSDEEKDPILTAENIDEAIAEYQKRFPSSKRSIPAIKREWYELRPEKRGEIPPGRKKGGINKAPLKGTAREKYKIPFTTKSNKVAYNNAVYICKKYDKPYNEAIVLWQKDQKAKELKRTEKSPAPKKPPATVSTSELRTSHEKKPGPSAVEASDPSPKKVLFSSGVLSPDPKKPEPPANPQFVKDMKVRYTGIRPMFDGHGIVKSVNQTTGEVLVDIGKGLEWIPGKHLVPAAGVT